MKCALAVSLLLTLASCLSVPRPPERYQESRSAVVDFMGEGEAYAYCTSTIGTPAIACANGYRIWIDNPCLHQGPYAALLCHELGHVNGWPGDHPKD